MNSEIKVNVIAFLFIFAAIIFVTIFILFDKKIGGTILNTGSHKSETSYYIADKDGNQKEISEKMWNASYKITIITFVFILLSAISLLYLFSRYIFIPTIRKNLQTLITFFRKT